MTRKDVALGPEEISRRLSDLPGWKSVGGAIERTYKTEGWPMTMMVVNAIGFACEAGFHHPDLNVSWGAVAVRLWTHSAGGITDKDFAMARRLDEVVRWQPEPGGALSGPPTPATKD